MQTIEVNIPLRLKEIREARKLTQEQVAKGIGRKRGTYQSYEEKRAQPPLTVLIKLAELYGLYSIDQLLGIVPVESTKGDELLHAYQAARPANQRIVELALNINC
jgi:transcriptional regulator with XRE-family HTH domain